VTKGLQLARKYYRDYLIAMTNSRYLYSAQRRNKWKMYICNIHAVKKVVPIYMIYIRCIYMSVYGALVSNTHNNI
jgi:hypothetical protein